jgi:hypothetical protein
LYLVEPIKLEGKTIINLKDRKDISEILLILDIFKTKVRNLFKLGVDQVFDIKLKDKVIESDEALKKFLKRMLLKFF